MKRSVVITLMFHKVQFVQGNIDGRAPGGEKEAQTINAATRVLTTAAAGSV